ncbi:MAG: alpha/beta hydrolase [Nocardioidaceae bacterium]
MRGDAARLDALGQGRFDVVGWALRGTRGAVPMVRCFADQQSRMTFWNGLSIPSTRAQSSAYLPKTIAFTRRCGAVSGRLLRHVSTTDDARDLDHLRRLVGDRRLTYSAVSYGTFLGQTYANMFPDRVRAMALDGLVDPRIVVRGAEARFANTVVAMDRGLRKFASLCQRAGTTHCALAGHGAVAPRVARLLARVQRAPIPAPSAQPPGRLSYGDLSAALFASLTNPAAWPQLAQDLEQAATGDGSALATQASAVLAGTRSADGEAPTAVTCTDSTARRDPDDWPRVLARMTRVSEVGGPFVGWSSWAPCASWPARAAERYRGPWNRSTKNPILVVGTTFDPATPFGNARRVARLLGDAVLLTHQGYGHTSEADPSACVTQATSSYLVELRIPRRGTVCASDQEPFDPQFGDSRD